MYHTFIRMSNPARGGEDGGTVIQVRSIMKTFKQDPNTHSEAGSNTPNKTYYITTSIPYANAGPHIGHILDPLIADVLARYHRIRGYDVRFLVGTDEHGAKIVRTAEALGQTPQTLVDENAEKYRKFHRLLHLSADDFIRTSDQKRHWPGAQKMWKTLVASGDIYQKKYRGLYCVGHEAFITEKDLVNGACRDHQKAPEAVEEENWFFKLSKYSATIGEKIRGGKFMVIPNGKKNEILALIERGLEDVSFSRPSKDLSWGVPVPDDPSQTMYVWCDALVNYISAIGYGHEDVASGELFKKWWPAHTQVIGKDNLRFHAAIWPGMLLSAGLPLPKTLLVHGFVNVDGAKISKTVGNVIMPETIIETYGVDPVRYYFLREFPSQEDGDFSYAKFEERYNGDLANGIGNLVSRVSTLGERIGRAAFNFKNDVSPDTVTACTETFGNYERHMQAFRLNEALADVWQLIGTADRFINEKKPWTEKDPAVFEKTIQEAAYFVSAIANFLSPFLPETAEKIRANIEFTNGRLAIKKSGSLFPRLG